MGVQLDGSAQQYGVGGYVVGSRINLPLSDRLPGRHRALDPDRLIDTLARLDAHPQAVYDEIINSSVPLGPSLLGMAFAAVTESAQSARSPDDLVLSPRKMQIFHNLFDLVRRLMLLDPLTLAGA